MKERCVSDKGGWEGIDLGLELALDVVEDSVVVLETSGFGGDALTNGWVPDVRVSDQLNVESDHVEVSSSDIVSSNMSSAISPTIVELLKLRSDVVDAEVDGLLRGVLLEDSRSALRLVLVISKGLKVPHVLIHLLWGGASEAVLVSEHHQDSLLLIQDLAIVVNVDWELVISVGLGSFMFAPLLKRVSHVLELNTSLGKNEADRLGATHQREVDNLGHLIKL